ncbi:MAG: spermidine synthase-like protein, partial [Rhodothermales bacterium]
MNTSNATGRATYRLHASIGVLSLAVIAFELVLIQLLSTVQWYHFAYMVISVALLGFGASGTLIALARQWLLNRFDVLLPLLMMASGATMAGGVALSQTPVARFDSYLLFVEATQAWALLLTYLLFFIPFFLGALAIGLVFVQRVEHIGSYYFANLLGSGLGGLTALVLLWIVTPERLPAVTGLIAVAAGLLIVPRRYRGRLLLAATAATALALVFLVRPPDPARSPYKSLSRALTLPDAEIVLERSSPYGLVQVVSAPALRFAPGLSLTYERDIPIQQAMFNNGNWLGPVTAWTRRDSTHLLDYTTTALPYVMRPRASVLVLNAGTGEYVAHAAARRVPRIVAVEPHGTVLAFLQHDLVGPTDSLFHHEAVSVHHLEPRTYLAADTARYDVITLPTVGAFGGTIGLSALQEHYILTKEGLRAMWDRLTPRGAVSITVWMDYPFRHTLKVLATLAEVLEEVGVEDPSAYLAAVRSWGAITFVLKKSPLTPEEIQNIRQFCTLRAFDPLLLPGLTPNERDHFNQMQDDQFFAYVDQLLSPDREALYATYDFAIAPATDNRPYFAQFLRWKTLPRLVEEFGNQTMPFLEIGYLIVGVTLIQIVLAALLLIVLPLFR